MKIRRIGILENMGPFISVRFACAAHYPVGEDRASRT